MTPEQLKILRQSFARIEPHAHQLSAHFYQRLFGIAPELRKLFSKDLKAQHVKFMKVVGEMVRLPLLSFPVTGVRDAQAYVPGSYWGGMLHGALGVKIEDFEPMRDALLWALSNTPGVEITAEEREAWAVGYDVLARAMVGGVEEWYVQEGGGVLTQPEPGAAFLKGLGSRSDAQEVTEETAEQTEQAVAFLKKVADRSGTP
ncbi:MAG: globin domain-containing protein [Rhodomicrobiaceae bacterium]